VTRRRPERSLRAALLAVALGAVLAPSHPAGAQIRGREAVSSIRVEPLRFHPPEAEEKRRSNGVTVFFLGTAPCPW